MDREEEVTAIIGSMLIIARESQGKIAGLSDADLIRDRAARRHTLFMLEGELARQLPKAEASVEENLFQEQLLAYENTMLRGPKGPEREKALGSNAETRARTLALLLDQDADVVRLRDAIEAVKSSLILVDGELEVRRVQRRHEDQTALSRLAEALMLPGSDSGKDRAIDVNGPLVADRSA